MPPLKKMAPHPVVVTVNFKSIGEFAMAENMDEHPCPGRQPVADPLQQARPVAHVLKHLNRDDPVKLLVDAEIIHICGNEPQIFQIAFSHFRLDEFSLKT